MNQRILSRLKDKPGLDDDGYAGTAPSAVVVENATKLLQSLPKFYQDILDPQECITPQAHGTIVIDWYRDKQFVSVEVGQTLVGFFTDFRDGVNPESSGIKFEGVCPEVILACLNKLYGRKEIINSSTLSKLG